VQVPSCRYFAIPSTAAAAAAAATAAATYTATSNRHRRADLEDEDDSAHIANNGQTWSLLICSFLDEFL